MKLVVIGTGYVGLVSGLCFAEFGFETICVDKDNDKLDQLKKGHSMGSSAALVDVTLWEGEAEVSINRSPDQYAMAAE